MAAEAGLTRLRPRLRAGAVRFKGLQQDQDFWQIRKITVAMVAREVICAEVGTRMSRFDSTAASTGNTINKQFKLAGGPGGGTWVRG